MAVPLSAATQGFPHVSMRRAICESLRLSSNSRLFAASSPCDLVSSANVRLSPSSIVRSAPPQNESLPEVNTAPLMAASVATRSAIAASSSMTFSSMTFIERLGMFQVTSAMPSASVSMVKFWNVIRVSVVSLILVLPGRGQ